MDTEGDALELAGRRPRGIVDVEGRQERFMMCNESFAVRIGQMCGKEWLVCMFIQQRVMMKGQRTVRVTGQGLKRLGVGRTTKLRVLQKLAEAGLIEFVDRGHGNPTVKVLGPLWLLNGEEI
jgi:hypothetical protein